jgi:hypothetical protein
MGLARFRSGLGCSTGDRADHHLRQRAHGQTSKPMSNVTPTIITVQLQCGC